MIWEEVAILLMGPLGMGVISWAFDAAIRRWDCPDDEAGTAGGSPKSTEALPPPLSPATQQGVGPAGAHGASAG